MSNASFAFFYEPLIIALIYSHKELLNRFKAQCKRFLDKNGQLTPSSWMFQSKSNQMHT